MAGINVTFTPDLGEARQAFDLDPEALEGLVFAIGELMVTQTKTRIEDEKRGPDGEAWAPWSRAYAATRSGRHSLLVGEGNLRDSISNHSAGLEAIVGTNLVYGAIQQFGGEDGGVPARPYLGLSGENRREIVELTATALEEMIQ